MSDAALAFVASIPWLAIFAWLMICNERAWRQRSLLIRAIYTPLQMNWRALSKDFDEVSYNAHLWRAFTFRNPFDLYTRRVLLAFQEHTVPLHERYT